MLLSQLSLKAQDYAEEGAEIVYEDGSKETSFLDSTQDWWMSELTKTMRACVRPGTGSSRTKFPQSDGGFSPGVCSKTAPTGYLRPPSLGAAV